MRINDCPMLISSTILGRSICSVQVGACLVDSKGRVLEVGWNSVGMGYGEHAEEACLRRARNRKDGYMLYVAARRKKSGNVLTARPCLDCQGRLKKLGRVMFRDGDSMWRML
jgi:deoxycytidylate deaminase